jgi:hypothetical protein
MNTWRATFFGAILDAVKMNALIDQEGSYCSMFHANLRTVAGALTSTLRQLSNNRLDPRAPAQIEKVVYDLGILSLEMGSQRSHVYLDKCQYGQKVKPGDRFKDETESRTTEVTVDLMTQPCLIRAGDGRDDLFSEIVIVKGDFVSQKT